MASSYRLEITTPALAAVALIGALKLGLLSALLAGLLVHQLVHLLTPRRESALMPHRAGKIIVVALLAVVDLKNELSEKGLI
jgi:uncharacterized protein (DUF2062 family)